MSPLTLIDTDGYQTDPPQTTVSSAAYAIDDPEYVGGIKLVSYNILYGGQPPNYPKKTVSVFVIR